MLKSLGMAVAAVALTALPVTAQELTKFRVQLGGIPLPSYTSPLYYAKDSGMYKEAGLDVEVLTGAVSQTSINAVLTGGVDIALVAGLATIQIAEKGQKLMAIGVGMGRNGTGIFYDPAMEVGDLTDFEGKKVLMPNPGTEEVMVELIKRQGGDPSKVEMVQIAQIGTLFGMFIGGQADGAVTLIIADSVFRGKRDTKFVGWDQYGLSEPMFNWVVTPDYLAANKDTLRKFLKVTYAAQGMLNEKPELQVDAYVANVPGAKPETVVENYSSVLAWQCAPGETVLGRFSDEAWQQSANLYKSVGHFAEDFDVTTMYTNELFDGDDSVSNVPCPK